MNNKITVKLVLAGVSLVIAGPLFANLRLVPPVAGFLIYLFGALVALIGSVWETIGLLKKRPVTYPAFLGFIPLLLVLLFFAKASAFPLLNDVSSDLDDIPAFVTASKLPENAGRDMSYPEEFKPLVRNHYSNLAGQVVNGTPDEVMTRTMALLQQRPFFSVTRDDRRAKEMEGTSETSFFRFKDDFILRFRAVGANTQVDMRSKSRNGKGDVGANAARILNTLTAIQKGAW